MQITKNIKCARAASRYRFWTIFFITLLLLPGLATNPARASEASLDSRLTSYGLTNPTVSTSNSKATIVYEQAIAEFNRLEEMLTQLAEVLVIVTEELPGTTRVVLRQYFDDGQIMEVETEANNGGIYLNEQISTQVFKDRLDFRPLTRGPLIIAGECEPGLGENCINCPECGCYPGENCDPSNPAANARGCVVMRAPEHAHLDGDEYVCDEGYEWSPGLSTCLPVVPCPEHAFKFQGECYCDPGYAWNETETACAKVTNLYYPHVACVGDWQTEICLINPSPTESLHGVLKFFSDTGVTVAADQKITLAPHARYQFTLTANSPGASELGYIVFASLSETMCGYLKFYLDGKYRVAIPATREKVSNDNIYISHIASDTLWWTGVSLLNTTPSSKQITITFDDGKTRSVTLAGNEHRALTISSLFDAQKQPGIHSAEISQAAGVVGLQLFGGGNQLSGILLKDDTTNALYYPHLVSDDTWWTGVVAYNPNAQACNLRITPYGADGSELASQTINLGGHEKYMGALANLNLPEASSWFKVESATGITGFELFGTNQGNLLAGYTGVGIASREAIFPKLEKNGWTGIAFANISQSPTTINLTFYNDAGNQIANGTIQVDGFSKILGSAENLLRLDTSGATYMNYSADREVVGFQLNGSSDNMMLDALPGM